MEGILWKWTNYWNGKLCTSFKRVKQEASLYLIFSCIDSPTCFYIWLHLTDWAPKSTASWFKNIHRCHCIIYRRTACISNQELTRNIFARAFPGAHCGLRENH